MRPVLLIVHPGLEGGAGGVVGFDGPGGGMSDNRKKMTLDTHEGRIMTTRE